MAKGFGQSSTWLDKNNESVRVGIEIQELNGGQTDTTLTRKALVPNSTLLEYPHVVATGH